MEGFLCSLKISSLRVSYKMFWLYSYLYCKFSLPNFSQIHPLSPIHSMSCLICFIIMLHDLLILSSWDSMYKTSFYLFLNLKSVYNDRYMVEKIPENLLYSTLPFKYNSFAVFSQMNKWPKISKTVPIVCQICNFISMNTTDQKGK